MLVKEIMTKSARTVLAETPLIEVVSLMCLYRYSGLPVVEAEGEKLVGFIAERDVLHRLFPSLEELLDGGATVDYDKMMGKYSDVMNLEVQDLMTEKVITVQPDMHILKAATVMARNKFRRIPVSDGGILVGMLSLGDVHKAIFQANISKGLCEKSSE
jgi:predicted transcriptional regulator